MAHNNDFSQRYLNTIIINILLLKLLSRYHIINPLHPGILTVTNLQKNLKD